MAFDGITVASLVRELNASLADGHISRIAQPEPDEILLSVKTRSGLKKVLPDGSVKAQPDDCAELLHASQKAYRIRPYSVCNTTFPGADCAF